MTEQNLLKKIDKYTFNVKQLLGKGCFGKVYRGYDDETKQPVAIKVIEKKTIQGDEYLMSGLFSEILVMKKLHSPFIV
jgi:serine/threonine protein kinase